tara:strand:+ start:21 stop:1124 length:1104 start_codon:yes stop_codon:yes gene_type:complete
MSEIRVNNLSNEDSTSGPIISGITTFSSPYFFVPPVGNTQERPENPDKGALRFNTDTKHLEYYKGETIGWTEIEASNDQLDGGYRGIFIGGRTGGNGVNTIEYVTISTLGNSADFGDLTSEERIPTAISNRTIGYSCGGLHPSYSANVDKITISSTGNATDSGIDLTAAQYNGGGASTQTRGLVMGGNTGSVVNTIQYMTLDSSANFVDFGDMLAVTNSNQCCSSTTRAISMGGHDGSDRINTIQYVEFATTGNAVDYGDLDALRTPICGSNATRGLSIGGGGPGGTNVIQYITMATTGNATDFGDTLTATYESGVATSPTRAVFNTGSAVNIEYIQIMTTGNSVDFGDFSFANYENQGFSNGHGGL